MEICIITARIRRMGEGTVFNLSVHTSIGRGGGGFVPIWLADGEGGREVIPSQVWMGEGYPIPGLDGVPYPRSKWGVPHPMSRQGVPHHRSIFGVPHPRSRWGGGVPHLRSGQGYPHPRSGRGYSSPHREWMGVPPPQIRRQISIASTCYATSGVPLAFTQEGFFVDIVITSRYLSFAVCN